MGIFPAYCRTKVHQAARTPLFMLLAFALCPQTPSHLIFSSRQKSFPSVAPSFREACVSILGVPGPLADPQGQCSRRSQQGPGISGAGGPPRQTRERRAQEPKTVQKRHGPILSVYKLCTPDHVLFQEEQSMGRWRDESKEVVLDSTLRAKFPLCTVVLPQLTSVIHYFKIGFSFAWKVFFFFPSHLPQFYKIELLLEVFFFFYLCFCSFVLRSYKYMVPWLN